VKPSIAQLLATVATTLATRIAPELNPDSYAVGDARMATLLAALLAQETDCAADTLVRENREMRVLFLNALQHDLPSPLSDRLAGDAHIEEPDLKISTLSAAHDRLSETLIALHATVEALDEDWARVLNKHIWSLLLRGAESRLLAMPTL
jgi:hypothetical protein